MNQDDAQEQGFEAALRALTDLHSAADGLVACTEAAERAFADGLRIGDQVRRAVRQGQRGRPGPADTAAVEAVSSGLRRHLEAALAGPEVARLEAALAAGSPGDIAAAARAVYADLHVPDPSPPRAYLALRPRRRRQGLEVLVSPAEIAAEIDRGRRLGTPRRPTATADADGADAPDRVLSLAASLPEPVTLDPSFDDAGSGLALAWDVEDLASVPLLCGRSGELWFFAPQPSATAAVALAREPVDEWWTASEVSWTDWSNRLREELARREIRVLDYSSSLPQ
ncbi:MAG: hypothetical protein ACKO2K_20850 [Alphaproteobacteria bacterium]